MGDALAVIMALGVIFFALNIAVLRWVFRVNKIVKTLESIDRSLQYLPAVRDARSKISSRKAA